MGTERFAETSWYSVLAQTLDVDMDGLTARLKDFRDRNGGEKRVTDGQIRNWCAAKPGAKVISRMATFLLEFLAEMEELDRIVDQDAAADLHVFLGDRLEKKKPGDAPSTHADAAVSENMDALFGFFLGRTPGHSRTPPGRGGFYLVLRRRYYGPSIYQELMYVGDNAGAPSYLITYSGRVLVGRVMFDGRRKAYGFFGAPYEGARGYSIRMLTMHFAEVPQGKPGTGMIARITSNKGMSTTSRTAYWQLSDDDAALQQTLRIFLNAMRQTSSVSLDPEIPEAIGQFVTEYEADHPVYKRLTAHLPQPDQLSDQGALADDWSGKRSEPSLNELLAHNFGPAGSRAG